MKFFSTHIDRDGVLLRQGMLVQMSHPVHRDRPLALLRLDPGFDDGLMPAGTVTEPLDQSLAEVFWPGRVVFPDYRDMKVIGMGPQAAG
jgi:hypothetical protein